MPLIEDGHFNTITRLIFSNIQVERLCIWQKYEISAQFAAGSAQLFWVRSHLLVRIKMNYTLNPVYFLMRTAYCVLRTASESYLSHVV